MWKYIIIGSVTLFLGASYIFFHNHVSFWRLDVKTDTER